MVVCLGEITFHDAEYASFRLHGEGEEISPGGDVVLAACTHAHPLFFA